MRRVQARAGRGRFTRNTLENCFGFSAILCEACRGFTTYNRGEPRPTTCEHCGVELDERQVEPEDRS